MKNKLALMVVLGFAFTTHANAASSQYETAKQQAAARYADDRKLCAGETTSSVRMQCLRDAKAEYDKALAAAKAAAAEPVAKAVTPAAKPSAPPPCLECGKVLGVSVTEQEGEGGPLGLIAGGVAGAVLGHQVGQGHGKDLATIAGAAGGAYAGHKIEQNMKKVKTWNVRVALESGEERNFSFKEDPGYVVGDPVKLSGSGLIRR